MKKNFASRSIILIGSVSLFITFIFTQCNRNAGEFRITKAQFNDSIYAGKTTDDAKAYDLFIWYKGKAEYPLKAVFYMVTTEQSGDYQKVETEIEKPGSPIVLKKFYKFWGFTNPADMVYAITLEEKKKDGKKTGPYLIKVRVHPPVN